MYVIFPHICVPFPVHIPIRRSSLNKRYLIIGLPVAKPNKVLNSVEKIQNVGRITKRALRIPRQLQWADYLTFVGKGRAWSFQLHINRLETI